MRQNVARSAGFSGGAAASVRASAGAVAAGAGGFGCVAWVRSFRFWVTDGSLWSRGLAAPARRPRGDSGASDAGQGEVRRVAPDAPIARPDARRNVSRSGENRKRPLTRAPPLAFF